MAQCDHRERDAPSLVVIGHVISHFHSTWRSPFSSFQIQKCIIQIFKTILILVGGRCCGYSYASSNLFTSNNPELFNDNNKHQKAGILIPETCSGTLCPSHRLKLMQILLIEYGDFISRKIKKNRWFKLLFFSSFLLETVTPDFWG